MKNSRNTGNKLPGKPILPQENDMVDRFSRQSAHLSAESAEFLRVFFKPMNLEVQARYDDDTEA
jgi:hypothetical protein